MKRFQTITYWVTTCWLALGMISTGIMQILKNHEGAGGLDSMIHLGFPEYLLPFIGYCKLMGVVVLFIPGKFTLKEWTYAGYIFLMSGALFAHIIAGDPLMEWFGPGLLIVLTVASRFTLTSRKKAQEL